MTAPKTDGRVPSAPGSREPSPDGLGPSGFDPSRGWRWPQIEFTAPTIRERVRNAIAASKAERAYSGLIGSAVSKARKDRLRPGRRGGR